MASEDAERPIFVHMYPINGVKKSLKKIVDSIDEFLEYQLSPRELQLLLEVRKSLSRKIAKSEISKTISQTQLKVGHEQ